MPAILVTDGHLRSSLAVVRSLGRAGYRVFVCSERRHSLAGASRRCAEEVRVPSPLTHADAFVDAIAELTRRWAVAALFPMSEESLLAVLPAAERLNDICVPFPPLESFRKAADKRYVTELATTLGIATPRQVVIEAKATTGERELGALSFPLVVKPSRSVATDGLTAAKVGVEYVDGQRELDAVLSGLPAAAFPVLLQERIRGHGTGVFLLVWNSSVLAQFAHRRIREKPPSGGVSVCSESIPLDPEIVRQSAALLSALNWKGPAMVEFKREDSTGVPYLMEINGRFWGSLQLAVDAGADFPRLLVEAALGHRPAPVTDYRSGVRCRWWWGEVDHLLARLRQRQSQGMREGWRAVRDFLLSGRGARNEVLRADDPWPFVRESVDWLRGR